MGVTARALSTRALSSFSGLIVTAFSALAHRTIFLAGSLLQPQPHPVTARKVVPEGEEAHVLLCFSLSVIPTNLRVRFTWNSRPSTVWP